MILATRCKIAAVALASAYVAFAVDAPTIVNRFSSGTVIRSSQMNENFDSLSGWASRLADTVNTGDVMRYSRFRSGDSTLSRFQADTAVADSLRAGRASAGLVVSDTLVSDSAEIRGAAISEATITSAGITAADMGTVSIDSVVILNGIATLDSAKITAVDAPTVWVSSLRNTSGAVRVEDSLYVGGGFYSEGDINFGNVGVLAADSITAKKIASPDSIRIYTNGNRRISIGKYGDIDVAPDVYTTNIYSSGVISAGSMEGVASIRGQPNEKLYIKTFETADTPSDRNAITIDTTPFVGINNTNPAAALDVGGSIKASGDIYTTALTDYSSSSTVSGFSSTSYKEIYYKKVGKLVFVRVDLSGESNSGSIFFTLPDSTAHVFTMCSGSGYRGGTFVNVYFWADGDSKTIGATPVGDSWNTSGTKSVYGNFFYFCK